MVVVVGWLDAAVGRGDVFGGVLGDVFVSVFGDVFGDVLGDDVFVDDVCFGGVRGDVFGCVRGDVFVGDCGVGLSCLGATGVGVGVAVGFGGVAGSFFVVAADLAVVGRAGATFAAAVDAAAGVVGGFVVREASIVDVPLFVTSVSLIMVSVFDGCVGDVTLESTGAAAVAAACVSVGMIVGGVGGRSGSDLGDFGETGGDRFPFSTVKKR